MRTVTAAAHNPHPSPSPSPSPSPLSLTPSFERAPTLLTPIVPDDADDDDDDPEEDRKKGDSLAVTVSHSGLNRRGREGAYRSSVAQVFVCGRGRPPLHPSLSFFSLLSLAVAALLPRWPAAAAAGYLARSALLMSPNRNGL